jgi:hypothetical protein
VVDQRKNLRERVARIESLLEALLDERSSQKQGDMLKSLRSEALPISPISGGSQHSPSLSPEGLYSTFNQPHWSEHDVAKSSSSPEKDTESAQFAAPGVSDDVFITLPPGSSKVKDERACKLLKDAMPPMEILQKALDTQAEWWTKITTCMVGPGGTPKELTCIYTFAKWALSAGGPLEVAKVLQFHMSHQDGYEELEKNLEIIDHLIIQDDEYMGNLSGVEVAFAQARHYSEIGQVRRAWLTTRRAISFAQLMGLHRTRINIRQDFVFWGLFQFDRFCSLMLGSPPLLNDIHCNLTFKGKDLPLVMSNNGFLTRLAIVAGKVLDRVQSSKDLTFTSLLSVDQEITRLGSQMLPEFWQLEHVAPLDFAAGVRWMDKSIGQIMYFQTRMVLHLPYLLRSVTSPGFEYSREACVESAREVLRIFQKIRSASNSCHNKVKGVDFIALIASTTIVMGLIGGIRPNSQQYDNIRQRQLDQQDWDLLEDTLQTYRRAETQAFGRIASQARRVLERLTEFRDPRHKPDETAKIVIPFFGTITVQRGAFRSADDSTPYPPSTPVTSSGASMRTDPRDLGISMQNGPLSQPTTPTIPLGGQIAYNGVYLQQSPYSHDYFQEGPAGISDQIPSGYLPPASGWQNVGTFDLDQDWNWDLSAVDMSAEF